jgi:DNA-binding beta-propeller fold protein YncE
MQRHSAKPAHRAAAVAVGLALLVAGCGLGAPEWTRPKPAAAPGVAGETSKDLVYTADPARGVLQVLGPGGRVLRELPAGVPSADWSTLYVARGGTSRTTIQAIDVASGKVLRSTTLPGRFGLPVVGLAGVPDGLSADGGTLVLANLADTLASRFAVLPTDFTKPAQIVSLLGEFDYDALSPDGARLFLIEHLAGPDRSRYRVRMYDRGSGKLDPNVIVDKREQWETAMAGYPNTRVAGPGGSWVYTLYRNADKGPFIHALNAQDSYAFCVDLPKGRSADQQAARLWTLVRDTTGGRLWAVNTALGLVSEIDGQQFTVLRTASFPPERPLGGADPRPGSAVLGDAGDLLLVGTADGVLTIATGSLEVERRDLAGWAVDGLVASADGRRAYALSSSRGRVAAIDPRSGRLLDERSAPAAGLLLHTATG